MRIDTLLHSESCHPVQIASCPTRACISAICSHIDMCPFMNGPCSLRCGTALRCGADVPGSTLYPHFRRRKGKGQERTARPPHLRARRRNGIAKGFGRRDSRPSLLKPSKEEIRQETVVFKRTHHATIKRIAVHFQIAIVMPHSIMLATSPKKSPTQLTPRPSCEPTFTFLSPDWRAPLCSDSGRGQSTYPNQSLSGEDRQGLNHRGVEGSHDRGDEGPLDDKSSHNQGDNEFHDMDGPGAHQVPAGQNLVEMLRNAEKLIGTGRARGGHSSRGRGGHVAGPRELPPY